MRGRFFLLMIVALFFSCEDPTTLAVNSGFNGNKLQTAYVDTFSVFTSVVQLDSMLTNNSGTILLGKYHDSELGDVSSSSYFQIAYSGTFRPDVRFQFDSIALILPYNHSYTGDTTNAVTLNVYQLTEQMVTRTLPIVTSDVKLSVFNSGSGFFNTSEIDYDPTPIVSTTVNLMPHKDSVNIRLPKAFGENWFKHAQATVDSLSIFSNPVNFVSKYFPGLRIDVSGTNGCVVGFKARQTKVRLYYKKLNGDLYQATHTDFNLFSTVTQFNHIEYDRTGTKLSGLQKLQPVSTSDTNTDNLGFVQAGTGLVTRLDFPTVKSFFSINNKVILSAAYLDVYPVVGTYGRNFLPPNSLQLYTTDNSSIPLSGALGGQANISYDLEYGVNTFYRYQLFNYIYGQLKSGNDYFTSLIIAPPTGSQGGSVQRLYFGDRFKAGSKIKLKIFYTYALN